MNLREPKTQKILIGCVALAAAGYVYFGTSFLPFNYPVRKAKIAQLQADHEKLAAEVEKARKVVGDLARLEAEYERLHDQWISAQELLPQEKEMPDLLRQVTTAGSRSGVEFALFEPEASVPHDLYTDHPITVTVRGNYHQVGSFMGRLSNLERIVNVTDLTMTQPNDNKHAKKKTSTSKKKTQEPGTDTVALSNNTVEAHFTLTAYTLLDNVSGETVTDQQADANAGADANAPATPETNVAKAGKAPKQPAKKGGKNAEQHAAQN
ncbi:MAG TPA: type 4a pilus biogenesis protein PilO [Candidatus Krumholzibacteria bacterium]|nr:type 4a pilus biogenesis protein PilO [Candidatus Krumholzibacteria bacterium]